MQKAIIIDDERLARNELKKLLLEFPEIEVIEEATNAKEGIEKIEMLNPDLIFLDIQMPGKTGFDMLQELDSNDDLTPSSSDESENIDELYTPKDQKAKKRAPW